MSLILHLETSTKACSVALSENGILLGLEESLTDEFTHSENLTVFIQTILKNCNKNMKQLDAVSVASGPGSYTGLRIGVSTAKGLCYSLGIPLIAIDSLRSLGNLAKKKYPGTRILAMIDARRMEVFSAIYDENGNLIKPISADILDENSYEEFLPLICVGDGVEKMNELWQDRDLVLDIELNASASGQVELAYKMFLKNEFVDVAYFEPFYLKDFMIAKPSKTN